MRIDFSNLFGLAFPWVLGLGFLAIWYWRPSAREVYANETRPRSMVFFCGVALGLLILGLFLYVFGIYYTLGGGHD